MTSFIKYCLYKARSFAVTHWSPYKYLLIVLFFNTAALAQIRIGVMDTGLAPELASKITPCPDAPIPPGGDPHGHGTNIVSIIEAQLKRVPHCYVIKKYTYPKKDKHEYFRVFDEFRTIPLDVLVVAQSGSGINVGEYRTFMAQSRTGAAIFVSAGNEGLNLDLFPRFPASYRIPNMIVVGCKAWFSNYGSKVRLQMPCINLGRPTMTGTSQATAVAAGRYIRFLYKKRKALSGSK